MKVKLGTAKLRLEQRRSSRKMRGGADMLRAGAGPTQRVL